ncbi:MAG TPA: QueT transporter family protein [Candidatus Aphodovivens excrementavium]|nr:QueT transporter family protein [Candidatus Aphodovivens excrementavium]
MEQKATTASSATRAMRNATPKSLSVARTGMIAAVYAAATLVALLALQGLAWGPVQFRISEAVCVLALLTPQAIPGLTIGCALANLIALVVNGTGALGMLDVVFGSLATCLGALWCWKMRERPKVAVLGPVIANALIVPAYLPLLLQGMGFYTIPFTSIALDGAYLPMYLFGLVATGIGEALVMYVLGLPLLAALKRSGVAKRLAVQCK